MHILHVEDNPLDSDLVARALLRARSRPQIESATNLAMARDLLRGSTRFDLALIDLRLPDGSGLDLLNEIRERKLPLPVVMLTGSGDQNAAIAALQSGADDYVPKTVEAFAHLSVTLENATKRFHEQAHRRSRALRVLYAEHNAADLDLTRRHLEKHAPYVRLTTVPDAVIALSLLPLDNAHPMDFDVILLDYRLPGIDALETVRLIRDERGLDIPIVIVSGQGSEDVATKAIHLGVDDYITKHPGYLYELAPTLEMVHRQFELRREQLRLQQTSQHLSYMLEASPVVLYTLRLREHGATPTWVSTNITYLFGYSPEDALAPDWWLEHVHPDDRLEATSALSDLTRGGRVQHDYRFYDKDKRIRWIRDELRVLPDAPGPDTEVLGAWHDITSRKLAEQVQQARIKALDGLVGGKPLESILVEVAEALETIRPEMRVSILLRDMRVDGLFTAAAPSLPSFFNAAVDGLKPERGFGSCGTAAATGEPVIVEDVMSHPYWAPYVQLAEQAGIRACWSVPFKDTAGKVLGTFGIYYDQTRIPDENELDLIKEFASLAGLAVQRANADTSMRQASAVFASTREGIVVTDLAPQIIAVNPSYTKITGYQESELLGRNPRLLQSGRQDEAFYQTMWASIVEEGHWQGEIWNRRKNGEIYPQLLTISTVKDSTGTPKNYVGVITDVSQIKQSEANLQRLAHYDPLTGLPNRLLIHSRLEHSLSHARREDSEVAILFVDVDRFKNVNDSLGHPVGDNLLQALTERLQEHLRSEDTFGRLGGDEFLIVLDQGQGPGEAAKIARKLILLLEEPFELLHHNQIYISASIGISVFPQDGDDASQLIQHADAAMYQAKEKGRNTFHFYTPALTEAVNQRMELESRMRRAINSNEFVLHYQPQVDIGNGRILGCEALVRWNDPDAGLVLPADFIALAEETGLIVPLGEWVLQTACAQLRTWLDIGYPEFCISINLSARQLQQQDFVAHLGAMITRYGLPFDRVKLELTESMIMGQGQDAIQLLSSLKALGVRLSIDDFGTGYSSLAYLKRFPIDELKIDRSFVRDIPDDESDAEIAATIIAMARNLRLNVVAEGVETAEQAQFLADHGCQAYQGYLFSRPLPADEFERLLQLSR